MFNLIKGFSRSIRNIGINPRIGHRPFINSLLLINRPKSLCTVANNVSNATFEDICGRKIYDKVVATIDKCKNQQLTEEAEKGYTSFVVLDEYDVRAFLPERYRYDSFKHMDKFVAKYSELAGFKISTVESGWPRRKVLLITW